MEINDEQREIRDDRATLYTSFRRYVEANPGTRINLDGRAGPRGRAALRHVVDEVKKRFKRLTGVGANNPGSRGVAEPAAATKPPLLEQFRCRRRHVIEERTHHRHQYL